MPVFAYLGLFQITQESIKCKLKYKDLFILGFASGGQHKHTEVVSTYISEGDGFDLFEVVGSMCSPYSRNVYALVRVRLLMRDV